MQQIFFLGLLKGPCQNYSGRSVVNLAPVWVFFIIAVASDSFFILANRMDTFLRLAVSIHHADLSAV